MMLARTPSQALSSYRKATQARTSTPCAAKRPWAPCGTSATGLKTSRCVPLLLAQGRPSTQTTLQAESVRSIALADFQSAARLVRASVGEQDLQGYMEWNETYGSFPAS